MTEIFDRSRLLKKKRRALGDFGNFNFLHNFSARLIDERLDDIRRKFPLSVFTSMPIEDDILKSLRAKVGSDFFAHLNIVKTPAAHVIADEEFFPFAHNTLDLIMSNLSLHQTNDLPGALVQMQRALKPDGLMIASLFGGETLWQLRQSLNFAEEQVYGGRSPRVHPFADKAEMGALMQRTGFALPVIDSEMITVTYPNIFKLMVDLRGMGETNIVKNAHKHTPSKQFFHIAGKYYAEHFCDKDAKLEATFEIIFILGWAPHASQQKPLKPGSAKTRLADFLNTEEIGAGEKVE